MHMLLEVLTPAVCQHFPSTLAEAGGGSRKTRRGEVSVALPREGVSSHKGVEQSGGGQGRPRVEMQRKPPPPAPRRWVTDI